MFIITYTLVNFLILIINNCEYFVFVLFFVGFLGFFSVDKKLKSELTTNTQEQQQLLPYIYIYEYFNRQS